MRRLIFSALALLALSGCKTGGLNPLKLEAPAYESSIVQILESVAR
jgi:hypothetical protein